MLIKTAEPSRQIERMLEKSARRRRLARCQNPDRDALQAVATSMSAAINVTRDVTASSRMLHHAKPYALPVKPRMNIAVDRVSRDVRVVTRWNVFGDMFL